MDSSAANLHVRATGNTDFSRARSLSHGSTSLRGRHAVHPRMAGQSYGANNAVGGGLARQGQPHSKFARLHASVGPESGRSSRLVLFGGALAVEPDGRSMSSPPRARHFHTPQGVLKRSLVAHWRAGHLRTTTLNFNTARILAQISRLMTGSDIDDLVRHARWAAIVVRTARN